jgi:hypothetical protein
MIDKQEIDAKADELSVHVANVQRDYVFGWLLAGLAQAENCLRPSLILKGGNCFRKAYFEHARFSNDLDFSTQTELDPDMLVEGLGQACSFAGEKSGVAFLVDQSRVSERSLADDEAKIYEARVYFKSFYGDIPIARGLQDKDPDVVGDQLQHSHGTDPLITASIRRTSLQDAPSLVGGRLTECVR